MNYTNAASIIDEDFRDTEDLDGIFSGLMRYSDQEDKWPFNGSSSHYDNASWQYARQARSLKSKWSLEHMALEELIRSLKIPPVLKDEKLQHPSTVFQLVRRHFRRCQFAVQRAHGCDADRQ